MIEIGLGTWWRLALLCTLAIASALACGEEERAPYFVPHQNGPDAGERDAGSGGLDSVTTGMQSMDEQLEELADWGADVEDPDKICAGWDHACAIDKQGKPWCWGKRGHASTLPPAELPVLVKIACGALHTCALGDDDSIHCWGSGANPDLVDVANQGQSVVPDGTYKDVASGVNALHTCAITADDDVVCWGAGSADSIPEMHFNFGQARPPLGGFRGITVGDAHSCALDLVTDEAVCWGGSGDEGCFPTDSFDCDQTETAEGAFRSLAAGSYHTCGLREDGSVACWGKGRNAADCAPAAGFESFDCGQSDPPDDLDAKLLQLRAGTLHTCGVTEDYEVRCWGWSEGGQIDVPMLPDRFTQVAPGDLHTCAISLTGALVCWGTGEQGEATPPPSWPRL